MTAESTTSLPRFFEVTQEWQEAVIGNYYLCRVTIDDTTNLIGLVNTLSGLISIPTSMDEVKPSKYSIQTNYIFKEKEEFKKQTHRQQLVNHNSNVIKDVKAFKDGLNAKNKNSGSKIGTHYSKHVGRDLWITLDRYRLNGDDAQVVANLAKETFGITLTPLKLLQSL